MMSKTVIALATFLVVGVVPEATPIVFGETPTASVSGAASNAERLEKERRIFACVNRERAARGLAPLRHDRSLARAARLHAKNMRIHGFFDHDDPFGRGPAERVAKFTGRYGSGVGENIGLGYPHSRAACAGWMNSPGHRANILNPDYVALGTGFTGGQRYWVQDFALAPPGDG